MCYIYHVLAEDTAAIEQGYSEVLHKSGSRRGKIKDHIHGFQQEGQYIPLPGVTGKRLVPLHTKSAATNPMLPSILVSGQYHPSAMVIRLNLAEPGAVLMKRQSNVERTQWTSR